MTPDLAALRPLLGRLNDLKRVRAAHDPASSLAQRGFARAWAALAAGADPAAVAVRETASALAAVELAGIDAGVLQRAGLSTDAVGELLRTAVEKAGAFLRADFRTRLVAAAASRRDGIGVSVPSFVKHLQNQPRAGATHPTEPRLILEPPESHADHCYLVAVVAALLAGQAGADIGTPFLAGLAHHLHNAFLPDAGFAGEELLGSHLKPVMDAFTAAALAELPTAVADRVRESFKLLPAPDSPEAEAFHAADVIDRVLEVVHYDRVARFRMADALDTLGLVHPGPFKPFQDRVLAAAGLVP